MSVAAENVSERELRFQSVAAEYLEAREARRTNELSALLARHPDLAEQITAFVAGQDEVARLAAPLRDAVAVVAATPDPGQTPPCGAADAPGRVEPAFSDYEVEGELARGGMGVVYRARQRSLNRPVALKVIRAGEWASAEQVRRFRNEAEMVALLDHPNIVPVHEVGEQAGQLYFSMRLVEGGSLAEHLACFRDDPRAAAGLLATVARAVHHAHQHGVLHRDLKPSNILLDAEGRPHVTDFGLGRRIEVDSSLTQPGALVGTPSYMAPEQTKGQKAAVTTAADVYGLGAILYALLTGRPPFQAENVLDTLVQVREREPQRPRGVNRRVPRDLETICLKCLAKDAERRYGSALALAEDLERFLRGEPIRARRVGMAEHLTKWARRRPAAAALVGVSAAAALGLLGGDVWFTAQLRREGNHAKEERDKAQAQQQLARQNLRKACDAVEQMLTRIGEERLSHEPRMTPIRRRLLEDAARFYEQFVQQGGNEPWVRAETARAYRGLAYVQSQTGQWDRAAESSRRAVDLLEQLRAEDPAECNRYELSLAYYYLGASLQNQGRLREEEEPRRRGIALAAELVSEAPGDIRFRIHLAWFQCEQGDALLSVRRLREAEQAYREALDLAEKLLVDFPANPGDRGILGCCQNRLGTVLATAGRLREAEKVLREALETYRKLGAESPSATGVDAATAETLVSLAHVLRATGRLPEAQELWLQALTLIENYVVDFPELVSPRETHTSAWTSLVALLDATGQRQEADRLYQRTGAVLERLVANSPGIPEYRRELATLRLGRAGSLQWTSPKEAEQLQSQALALAEQLAHDAPDVPANQCLLVDCRQLLAYMLARTGRHVEAKDLCQRTLRLAQKLAAELPADPEQTRRLTDLQRTYGMVLRDTARPREAENAFRRAAETAEKLAANFPDTPAYRLQSAFVYEDLMELRENASWAREVEEAYCRAVEHLQKGATDFPTETAFAEHLSHCHRKWAYFLLNNDRLPQAEEALHRAVRGLDKLLADLPPAARPDLRALLGDTYVCLGCMLSAAGRRGEAAEALRKSREFPPPSDAGGCECQAWTLLAVPDASLVDVRRPVELARKAVELAPEDARCRVALGMAYCRAKEWKAAVEAVEKSNELTGTRPWSVSGAFCLAIAHWHLGHKEQARSWYDRAVASLAKHPAPNANDRRLRAEAEKLIGVQGPPMK
jgi:serine/threonine-protein kinase